MKLNDRELATMLAALRVIQKDPDCMAEMDHFDEGFLPLSADEIDSLCERLNHAED